MEQRLDLTPREFIMLDALTEGHKAGEKLIQLVLEKTPYKRRATEMALKALAEEKYICAVLRKGKTNYTHSLCGITTKGREALKARGRN